MDIKDLFKTINMEEELDFMCLTKKDRIKYIYNKTERPLFTYVTTDELIVFFSYEDNNI